jgi:hypothetical protein
MKLRVPSPDEKSLFTAVFMGDYLDCPHLTTPEALKFRQKMIAVHGLNSTFIRSTLFGEFGRDTDDNHVFFEHDLAAVKRAMSSKVTPVHGKKRAGVDLSTTAEGDEKILYIADGTEVMSAFTCREEDTTKVGDYFVQVLRQYQVLPQDCKVDNGGSGKPIADYMERIGYRPIHRYMNNQTALFRAEFRDRITEDHYHLKELLHTAPIRLPFDVELLTQMQQRKAPQDDHGQRKLQAKKELRNTGEDSPDRLDTLVMALCDMKVNYAPGAATPEQKATMADIEKQPWKAADWLDARSGVSRGGPCAGLRPQKSLADLLPKLRGH